MLLLSSIAFLRTLSQFDQEDLVQLLVQLLIKAEDKCEVALRLAMDFKKTARKESSDAV